MCDQERNCSVRLKTPTISPTISPLFNENESNCSTVSLNNAFNFGSVNAPNSLNALNSLNSLNSMNFGANSGSFNLSEYHRSLQFYDYALQASLRLRLQASHPAVAALTQGVAAHTAHTTHTNTANSIQQYGMPSYTAFDGIPTSFQAISPFALNRFDSRFRFIHEEPKPQHSYIGLIAMAILSCLEQKMVLSDIYQHILDNYPYFRNRGPGWRNSIRHNLSLNDCFVKAGRSANGKGHYWAIHPANIEDFKKGDFRRRKAQRKVRKHMGLSVADEDDSPSPTPPPLPTNLSNAKTNITNIFGSEALMAQTGVRIHSTQLNAIYSANFPLINDLRVAIPSSVQSSMQSSMQSSAADQQTIQTCTKHHNISVSNIKSIKRQFDVESLLAPDCDSTVDDSIT